MGKGRTIASIVAVVFLVGLSLGGCGSSKSSAKAQARTAAQAKAARAKVAAAKRRLAAAKARVAAQRRALAAEVRRRRLREAAAAKAAARRAASTTTTTTGPGTVSPTTTPGGPEPPSSGAPTTSAADVVAIQHTIDTVNAAFATGVAPGIAASEFANYYIDAGVYTEGQCSAFEAARGLGLVTDHLVVHPGSIVPAPGWVDPVLRAKPKGRVYGLTMDDIQTQVTTKQTRTESVTTHATVRSDGRAQLFFRCR